MFATSGGYTKSVVTYMEFRGKAWAGGSRKSFAFLVIEQRVVRDETSG